MINLWSVAVLYAIATSIHKVLPLIRTTNINVYYIMLYDIYYRMGLKHSETK